MDAFASCWAIRTPRQSTTSLAPVEPHPGDLCHPLWNDRETAPRSPDGGKEATR